MHPFQKSGLGTSPFRCVGMFEKVIRHADGSTQAGGTCDHCGTGIRYCFQIKASEGHTFVVGCDCVAKTGHIDGFREVRLQSAREKRQAGAQARRAVREAGWAAEREERRIARLEASEQWRADNADVIEFLKSRTDQGFFNSLSSALEQYGSLTEGQLNAVRNSMERAKAQEEVAESRHIGEVGKRVRGAQVKVVRTHFLGKSDFYPFPPKYVSTLVTDGGNVLSWFTSTHTNPTEDFAECSYTVKGHGEYQGIKQTQVTRLSFK